MSKEDQKDLLLDFIRWQQQLTPADKCTVHAPAGSGGSTGLYNLTDAAIIDKFINKPKRVLCPEKINGSCPHHNLHCGYPECEDKLN